MRGWRLLSTLALASSAVCAAPYVPSSDAQILETLPSKAADPAAAELRRLRAAHAAAPGDPDAASALASRYFDLAMAEGDPRYVGYAEGVLRAWPETAATPPGILVLHGKLRQYRHDFPRAMADFDLALRADPENLGARAWRAALFMVQADYAGARRECELLAPLTSELHAVACTAYVDATTGRVRAAYARLRDAQSRDPGGYPELRAWVQSRLAEMAWRAGDLAAAERHFREGLAAGVDDNFLLAAYADFLLERGRAAEVMSLLRNWARSDTLLLRLALAAQALRLPEADRLARTLGERFAEAGLRGERLHLQEEARYQLELRGDARAALAAAAENYRTQREPRDTEILLRAALAAGEPAAAAPALSWMEESGFEGESLRGVVKQLNSPK